MLSNRIDLTANRDFGHRQTIVEMDMGIFDRWYDDDSISLDEYDYLVWWEGVFGKTRHTNERRKLFEEDELLLLTGTSENDVPQTLFGRVRVIP